MIENRIAEVLTERFKEEDLSSCFLVGVDNHKNNKVVVYIDSDDQLTIDMCRRISRYLEKTIEENSWLPEKYTLDVSSPGTDNPIKLHRQYIKNVGRKVSIKLLEGDNIMGRLNIVGENSITIDVEKKGLVEVQFDNISETKSL